MKQDKEIEQILLDDEKYEQFIKDKTEKDFNKVLEQASKKEVGEITDFKQMKPENLFSKNTTYFVINKMSKTTSYINGMQAESFLVSAYEREKFISGKTDAFIYQDNYIKFFKYKG
ncbi:hypothetical protein IJ674_04460 [bacterium]|jgi:hypothetical protein|nr:hypothetical protein [bacterium]MBR1619128.1 hypothetical protein [bacterium]